MEKIKRALELAYAAAVASFGVIALVRWTTDGPVLELAAWAPAVGTLAMISGQMDLLVAIESGKMVNLRARILDFIHWILLIGVNIGAWLIGATDLSWFALKIILVAIIGWQIGVGLVRRSHLNIEEQTGGLTAVVFAVISGLGSGYARALDASSFGWGWTMETATAILATMIVLYWMKADLGTMRKNPFGYPRSVFHKAMVSNALVLWFWFHVIATSPEKASNAWLIHLGLTINILVGNTAYLCYYGAYEYYRMANKIRTA